ncbi:MAG: 30S ribosomal protein S8 [Chloroflexi bacterium]|nr:30S ribosomal protein S8 [Chloroflexota bacterium]
MNDTIGDMLTRLRNAGMARLDEATMPKTKLLVEIARILKAEGFITDYRLIPGTPFDKLAVRIKYGPDRRPAIVGLKRVSKPGLRIYTKAKEVPRVRGGLGIAIVSTSRGVMTGSEAYRRNLGGELLAQVW